MAIMIAFGVVFANAAQAQTVTQLSNGGVLALGGSPTVGLGITAIDLGSSGVNGFGSSMPMSLSYGSVNVAVTFQGDASLYYGTTVGVAVAPVDTNYFRAGRNGSVTLDFSEAQRYFSMRWGTQGNGDSISFYNQGQLVTTVAGSTIRPMSFALTGSSTSYTNFSFNELAYDRVVLNGGSTTIEAGGLSFAAAPDVAPIPVGGLGGLIAFLGFMGLRRRDRLSLLRPRWDYAPERRLRAS